MGLGLVVQSTSVVTPKSGGSDKTLDLVVPRRDTVRKRVSIYVEDGSRTSGSQTRINLSNIYRQVEKEGGMEPY